MPNNQIVNKIIVAIDGYSSCGKSTIAKALAKHAGYTYVDTGAMYRATALYAQRLGLDNDLLQVVPLLNNIQISFIQTANGQHVTLNGEDVEAFIRTLEIGNLASQISTIKEVRAFLVAQQQAMGDAKGIVMDGRDIGTVVFPNAELKLFLTASPEVRAERRFKELQAKGENPVFDDVLRDTNDRDYRDTHRAESPLRQADDAVVVDNSHMTREEQMNHIIEIFDRTTSRQLTTEN
jgi:cytidylate kinase